MQLMALSLRDACTRTLALADTLSREIQCFATSDNERNSEHLHSIDGDTNGLGSLDIAMSTNPLKTRLSGNVMEEETLGRALCQKIIGRMI